MKKNNKIIISASAAMIALLSFWGGMQYGKSSESSVQLSGSGFQRNGALSGQGRKNGQSGVNVISGEITSRDDKSITVKSRDGSSRFIFFSATTQIGKSTDGTVSDLEIGKQVSTNGVSNSDGSITAQSIQIRPATPNPAQ